MGALNHNATHPQERKQYIKGRNSIFSKRLEPSFTLSHDTAEP